MKYYGIKKKIKLEDFKYHFQKSHAWLQAKIPGKTKERRKEWYTEQYTDDSLYRNRIRRFEDSRIPEGHKCELYCIVTSDLIKREDIADLQKGIRKLLKWHKSSKFLGMPNDSLEEIENKIYRLDSIMPQYYNSVDCGMFDFTDNVLHQDINHYGVCIRNINSTFLAVEFMIFLTEEKLKHLNAIIATDFQDKRGYPTSYLMGKRGRGSITGYTVSHFFEPALKADKIFEFLSYIQWEFYNELNCVLPLVLHRMGLMPPRIDIFKTDIDYREDHHFFWDSIGVRIFQGQFIDENHKFFFSQSLSGRYEESSDYQRLIYLYREDGKTQYKHNCVESEVYRIIKQYGVAFFVNMFSNVLVDSTSKKVIRYKHVVNKIKLKRNQYRRLLKKKYEFERDIDLFERYTKDDPRKKAKEELKELFEEYDTIGKVYHRRLFYGWEAFYNYSMSIGQKLTSDIGLLADEIEEKKSIHQTLFDYKNVKKTWIIGILTLAVSVLTLIATIFPDHVRIFIEWIKCLLRKE